MIGIIIISGNLDAQALAMHAEALTKKLGGNFWDVYVNPFWSPTQSKEEIAREEKEVT